MKLSLPLLLISLVLIFFLTACVPGANSFQGTVSERGRVAGFGVGLWQGFVAPFVFIASLFRSDLNIYEVHNNGGWYNFGYLFGLACFFGGSGKGASRSRSSRPRDSAT